MKKKTRKFIFQLSIIIILILCIYFFYDPYPSNRIVVENSSSQPEVYFCPTEDCMDVLINLTKKAEKIDCAFYDLDLEPLIGIFEEKKSGMRLVIDNRNYYENEDKLAEISNMIKISIPNHQMHNKFCIFDERIIATGSFNPTKRGNYKNNNNLVVIQSEYLVKNYEDEFIELWR